MNKIAILAYHRVDNSKDDYNFMSVNCKNFKKQMEYIKNNYSVIPLDKVQMVMQNNDNTNYVVLTFDDGYKDIAEYVLPILTELRLPATFFISTQNIDKESENWNDLILRAVFNYNCYHREFEITSGRFQGKWKTETMYERIKMSDVLRIIFRIANIDERKQLELLLLKWSGISKKARKSRHILSSQDIYRISQTEGMTIGAHTVNHLYLTDMSRAEQEEEIRTSINELEKICNTKINCFSYPFGAYNQETIQVIKENSITYAVTTERRIVNGKDDCLLLPRFGVRNYDIETFIEFMQNEVFRTKEQELYVRENNYFFGFLKDDLEYLKNKQCIIWGTGKYGDIIYEIFTAAKITKNIVAFGDNDKNKQGRMFHQIKIMNYDEIYEKYGSEMVFITAGKYAVDVFNYLETKKAKYIHLVIV